MSLFKPIATLLIWAGLWLAPLAWAVNMQLGQILPYTDCYGRPHTSAIASFASGGVAALSGIVSWRCARQTRADLDASREMASFAAMVSALSAFVFTFALVMQGIAAVMLTGCER